MALSKSQKLRRLALLGIITVGTSGCASIKSPTEWFSKSPTPPSASFTTKMSETGKGISGQFKSMGSAVSSAYSKTKAAVTGTLITNKSNMDPDDPTSLANMPTNLGPEIWITNGQLYETKGNYPKALDNYTKALELEPNSVPALLSTARLYSRQKEHPRAIEFYKKALKVSPDAQSHTELAMCYLDQGNPDEAQASARQAIELDPSNTRYRNNLAGILVKCGRSDEAVRELEQVFPTAVSNYNVAYLHVQNQNLAAAQQHLQTALSLDPSLTKARELMQQLGNSGAARTAVAAYQGAQGIYRTAEGNPGPQVPADEAVYQLPGQAPGAGTQPFAPAQSSTLPQVPSQSMLPTPSLPTTATGPTQYMSQPGY